MLVVIPTARLLRVSPNVARSVEIALARSVSVRHTSRNLHASAVSRAQVSESLPRDANPPPPSDSKAEPIKLGKKARKAIRAQERLKQKEAKKLAKAKERAQANAQGENAPSSNVESASNFDPISSTIVKVKDVLPNRSPRTAEPRAELQEHETGREESDLPRGWSAIQVRNYVSSLLYGFGTLPSKDPRECASEALSTRDASSSASDTAEESGQRSGRSAKNKSGSKYAFPPMTKAERMESQARVIFQAIKDARERGIIDEDESFFHPYPEGVPPQNAEGRDMIYLNLGPRPEAWGKHLPPVKDRWLEVLSLGLTREIRADNPNVEKARIDEAVAEPEADEAETLTGDEALLFSDLVDDYDLEDHERLEQLGDSIVNMSSRLLAYRSFPDINEGALTRLSNYPTQNNLLALLFQECGLATRRLELRDELRRTNAEMGMREGENTRDTDITGTKSSNDGSSPISTPNETVTKEVRSAEQFDGDKFQLPALIKRDADMFEAYVAAVFLSHDGDFKVVHDWLSELFRPFQDQAFRFMSQRSEALMRLKAGEADKDDLGAKSSEPGPRRVSDDKLLRRAGIESASIDPVSTSSAFSSLFPGSKKGEQTSAPLYGLQYSEPFITDEFLTTAARARRRREERLREELRKRDQEELMKMGWFQKGFLKLSQGFRQHVLGKNTALEEEQKLRERVAEERGLSKKERLKRKSRTTLADREHS